MSKVHDFSVDRDEWERAVFDEAEYFTVVRRHGRGNTSRNEHRDFLKAIEDAVTGPQLPIPMVYAVAGTGRFVMIPKPKWIPLMNEYARRVQEQEAAR